jgi:hypothetical protein
MLLTCTVHDSTNMVHLIGVPVIEKSGGIFAIMMSFSFLLAFNSFPLLQMSVDILVFALFEVH